VCLCVRQAQYIHRYIRNFRFFATLSYTVLSSPVNIIFKYSAPVQLGVKLFPLLYSHKTLSDSFLFSGTTYEHSESKNFCEI
jgi:hypothetical protein